MPSQRKTLNGLGQRNTKVRLKKNKEALAFDLSLTHFDPKLNVAVISDPSDSGNGAIILHQYDDGTTKQIVYASISLIAAEKNYSQIEKEVLVIIFAMKKFHKFVHGREFFLQTDHHPLLSIYGYRRGFPYI